VLKERINWRAWWRAPLAIPALLFAAVFVIATCTSVLPRTSWWGSYQRGQGTYTNLAYIGLFAVIVGNLRSRAQLQRLLTTAILTGVSVSMYGLVQHFGLDPLPWQGNVITRISSTMGNSIFVAAYLIMIVPFLLYRLVMAGTAYRAAPTGDRAVDRTWLGFIALLIAGQQFFLLGVLKFMASVRLVNGDFRYWWVFPFALALVAGTFALVNERHTVEPRRRVTGWLLGGFGTWAALLLLMYLASGSIQRIEPDNAGATDWWLWLLLGWSAVVGSLVAQLRLPRRAEPQTRTFAIAQFVGYGIALLVTLLAIFFSQSRGPWIGGMASLGVFGILLLLRLMWTGREQHWAALERLKTALWSVIGIGALLAALLVAFNVSDAPFFERLRDTPYLGRLGRLLETDDGTGRVRVLIWFGDDQGGGAVGMLRSNLARTLTFGHGPETMFTAYNPFYPPSLAQYEARGASPDRSHQAWLDELISKGAFGLLSYFFLFGSAFALAWRQIRRVPQWECQVLAIAALSAILAHFVEVLVGIPIVSTLTMLWTSFGVLVVGGVLAGLYTLDGEPVPAAEPAPISTAPAPATKPARRGKGQQRPAGGRTIAATQTTRSGGLSYVLLPLALIAALMLAWNTNLKNNYADMYINRAQGAVNGGTLEQQIYAYQQALRAVEIKPNEDYYHLQLGNTLLGMVLPHKLAAQRTFDASTAPRANQRFEDLFAGDPGVRGARLFQNNSVEQLLQYGDIILQRAHQLNPGNKDHPANLGRLHSAWARRAVSTDAERATQYDEAARWFTEAHRIAPNDAAILNELATVQALQGNIDQAEANFQRSIELDPRYPDTRVRLGEVYRVNGRLEEAAAQFAEAVKLKRTALDSDGRQLDAIVQSFAEQPQAMHTLHSAFEEQYARYGQQIQDAQAAGRQPPQDPKFLAQLARVRAATGDQAGMQQAFEQALTLAPDNVVFRRQYTVALSDTLQFNIALQQAEQALQQAQRQQLNSEASTLQQLIATLRTKISG
jgi:tetratricopeptide (TPR) repeat protein